MNFHYTQNSNYNYNLYSGFKKDLEERQNIKE